MRLHLRCFPLGLYDNWKGNSECINQLNLQNTAQLETMSELNLKIAEQKEEILFLRAKCEGILMEVKSKASKVEE